MVGLQVTVERRAPRAAGAVGVVVPARGAVPREIPLSRAQLAAMGFEGKSGQVASIPGRDRKSTRLNSSHVSESRMPSSA